MPSEPKPLTRHWLKDPSNVAEPTNWFYRCTEADQALAALRLQLKEAQRDARHAQQELECRDEYEAEMREGFTKKDARIAELEAELKAARGLVREAEWVEGPYYDETLFYPWCEGTKPEHDPDCPVHALYRPPGLGYGAGLVKGTDFAYHDETVGDDLSDPPVTRKELVVVVDVLRMWAYGLVDGGPRVGKPFEERDFLYAVLERLERGEDARGAND